MASVLELRPPSMTSHCYCCPPSSPASSTSSSLASSEDTISSHPSSSSASSSMVDLDVSLHELGMLSSVIDARRDYLMEKLRRGLSCQKPQGLCIVAMNSAYLADFSVGSQLGAGAASRSTVPLLTLKRTRMKSLRRRRHCLFQPYDYPWRPKLMEKAWALLNNTVPKEEENGNKSNPGSPTKSQGVSSGDSSEAPLGSAAIFRSRSLDDLCVCATQPPPDVPRLDIDTVSHRISNLSVS
uniref:Uncharacterized protein n=1 Tax=Ornithodoros turicata TaxID=34597 RepID=A0A2R5LKQ7_9ACAR